MYSWKVAGSCVFDECGCNAMGSVRAFGTRDSGKKVLPHLFGRAPASEHSPGRISHPCTHYSSSSKGGGGLEVESSIDSANQVLILPIKC